MGTQAQLPYAYYELKAFSDPSVNGPLRRKRDLLDEALKEGSSATETIAQAWIEEAKSNRTSQDRAAWIESACNWLLLAQYEARELPDIHTETGATQKADKAVERFHFAANELRRADLLERSAQAYFNAAVRSLEVGRTSPHDETDANKTLEMGIRSAGRAQSMFDDLGEWEKADTAHALRMDLLRRWRHNQKSRLNFCILQVWGGLTRYGTSPGRWLGTLAVVLVVMTGIYAVLAAPSCPEPSRLIRP